MVNIPPCLICRVSAACGRHHSPPRRRHWSSWLAGAPFQIRKVFHLPPAIKYTSFPPKDHSNHLSLFLQAWWEIKKKEILKWWMMKLPPLLLITDPVSLTEIYYYDSLTMSRCLWRNTTTIVEKYENLFNRSD